MTVAENVELPAILAAAHGPERPAEGRTVAELLDLFEVSELVEKLPEEISGGQAQRVGPARAFVGRPRPAMPGNSGVALLWRFKL